jgi:hypothetical protein
VPVVYGLSSGTAALPSNAFTIGAARRSAIPSSASVARSAPWVARIAIFVPQLRTSATRPRSSAARQTGAARGHVRGVMRHVALGALARDRFLLDVERHAYMRHPAIRERRAAGEVGDVLDMGRSHDPCAVRGDVDEQPVEFDVLLRVGTDQVVIGQARDRQTGCASSLAS